MRRLFGFKEKKDSAAPAQRPSPSSSLSPTPGSSPPATTAKPNGVNGLGLSLPPDFGGRDLRNFDPPRQSRHVQFDSSEAALGPPPSLHPQASFESRHGTPTSAAANCFARPTTQSESASVDCRPGQPKAPQGRDVSVGAGSELRTTSPLSLSPSAGSCGGSSCYPYSSSGVGMGMNPSLSRLADRDPSRIYAPLTWSELAHQDLVDNVSTRERTRQEILWEVVSSEERYVLELRSLVEHYVNPLLHPLLSPPSSPLPHSKPPSPAPFSSPSLTSAREELPIAARFLRSIGNLSLDDTTTAHWESGRHDSEMPDIEGSELSPGVSPNRSRQSLPVPARVPTGHIIPSSPSATSLNRQEKRAGRLSSLPGFRPRHPLRPEPAGTKLLKASSKVPAEAQMPPPLPDGLRRALEVIPDMLRGHEELSARLKDQWARAFPLVRGLALIWSDQPWFLEVYAKYIISLEEALETIDRCLPSNHSPFQALTLLSRQPKSQADKDTKKLARFIMSCEEAASVEGEASLAIALSKPLMRLGKLPLLMQSLLYHTDATTVEYEKTRAMALEVDALVRSIEDEKVDEDEREKVRDVLARIEGIKDKALMAPRSSRVLIEEVPASTGGILDPPSQSPALSSRAPRRAVSDSTSVQSHTRASAPITTKKSAKRLSDIVSKRDEKKDWFVRFSDVTIRCIKTGTTDIPGGFSREKEKQGKQGKTKKKGTTRNLYRFVKVEQWEMREMTDQGFVNMTEISRSRSNVEDAVAEATDDNEEEEDDSFDSVSRMSFTYDADDPKPVAPRNFKDDLSRPGSRVSARSGSTTTRSVVAKHTPAKNKFGGRLPAASSGPSRRFEAPTAASLARATASSARSGAPAGRIVSPTGGSGPAPPAMAALGKRRLSSPALPTPTPLSTQTSNIKLHERDDSTLGIYEAYWTEASTPPVPFPRS